MQSCSLVACLYCLYDALDARGRACRCAVGTTSRVSVATGAIEANNISEGASISNDGRYVASRSTATNLVPNDTNGFWDIFVYDRQTGETTRVSGTEDNQTNSDSEDPSISGDGRYVAFASLASNLVVSDTNNSSDIFVHDRLTGETTRVSVASDGTQAIGDSDSPSMSADGGDVAFRSVATNLVITATNSSYQVYVHTISTHMTTRVSVVASSGTLGNGNSEAPSLSGDGRYVAFSSYATNLVINDTNGKNDIFVHDCQTGETTRISVSSAGAQADNYSEYPSFSTDGRYVVFDSRASNLVSNDTNNKRDIFIRDLQTNQTTLVSVASDGTQGNGDSLYPVVNQNGRHVAYHSSATNLIVSDTNVKDDVFLHYRLTGDTTRASVATEGIQGDEHSDFPSLSGDGANVTFRSAATNLVSQYEYNVREALNNEHPIDPPIFVTSLSDNGSKGTLRWAIAQANDIPGDDVIEISTTGTIVLTDSLSITSNIFISGPGASALTITGSSLYRVFSVDGASTSFWLKGLTIADGNATGGNGGSSQKAAGGGGAVGMGGALFINNSTVVTVTEVIFRGNVAQGGDGGAVSNSGTGGGGGGGIGGLGASSTSDTGGVGGSGAPLGSEGTGGAGGNHADNGLAGGGFGGAGGGAGARTTTGGVGGNGGFGGGGGGDAYIEADVSGIAGLHGGKGGNGTASLGGGGGGGGGLGGAIFVRAGTLNLIDCTFIYNGASHGEGGAVTEQPTYNGAVGQGKGGAIYIYSGATANAMGATFSDSITEDGLATPTDNPNWYGTLNIIERSGLEVIKSASTTQVKPGDTVTFTLTYRNYSEPAATNVTLADIIPPEISVTQIVNSGIRITNTGATPGYEWQIADVVSPTIGMITVTGVLTTPLARGLVITNSATITGYFGTYTNSTSYVTLKVQNVAPVLVAATRSINENVAIGTIVGTPITGTDSNDDGITFRISAGNTVSNAFSINSTTGQIIVSNALDFETKAQYTLTVQVSDGPLISSGPVTVNIVDVNDPPHFSTSPAISATEDTPYIYNAIATDEDAGSVVTITVITIPTWLTYTLSGHMTCTISGTPSIAEVGLHPVVLQVEVEFGLTTTQSYSLTVHFANDRPIITSSPVTSATQDVAYTYVISTTDPNLPYGDVLTISAVVMPTWLTFTPTTNCTATLSGTPGNGDVGSYDVELRVVDSGGLTYTQVFSVVVANVNDPPLFDSTPAMTATQDMIYTYVISTTDPDLPYGDVLTITAVVKPNWLTFTSTANYSATLSGTPGNSDVGNHPVRLQVVDSLGITATQIFTVVVVNVNDAPNFTSSPVTSATQDLAYTYVISTTDPDMQYGDVVTISAVLKPAWLTLAPTGIGAATLSGTPGNSDVGNNQVRLQVVDRAGVTTTQVFTVVVANVNDKPSFTSSPTTTVIKDVPYTYTVVVNDLDLLWGDVLTISVVTKPTWLGFAQVGTITGSLFGTPSSGDLGEHAVELLVTDSTGLTATQRFTLTIYDELYNLTVNIVGEGNVSINPDKPNYLYGDVVTLTATSGWSWRFDGWSGDISGSEKIKVIVIESNLDITATFITKRIFIPKVSK